MNSLRILVSPYPPVDMPHEPMADYFLARIAPYGHTVAMIDAASGRSVSFIELAAAVRRFARVLAEHGMERGAVVALWSPNCIEYPVAFHGASLAGAVVTLLNPVATDNEVIRQLRDCGAAWLVAEESLAARARGFGDEMGALRVLSIHQLIDGSAAQGIEADGHAADNLVAPLADRAASQGSSHGSSTRFDELAVLPYSSGTTGAAKGVMLTHRNVVANLEQVQAGETIGRDDVAIAVLPFFHIYGLTVVMNMTLVRGTRLVVMSRFEPTAFLEALQQHRVTRAYLAPPLVLFLARHPLVGKFNLSALTSIISGAASLDSALALECEARVGAPVTQGYGLTETSPGITRASSLDPLPRPPGTIGRLLPGTEARLVDPESGADVPPGVAGELWVRGPQVMKGYLGRPDESAHMLMDGGWLRTGDLVTSSADGFMFVVDRLKELIKYKGYQVAPSELEAILLRHPAVSDCAVIAKYHAEAGEIPKAFVVQRSPVQAGELLDWVAAEVAPYKKVREVEFIQQIPKSPAGKILRRVLLDRERATGADKPA